MIWILIISIAMLLIGLADLPTGYYMFVRIIVCWASIYSAYKCYKTDERVGIGTIAYALLAILFNPIIPVYLYDKEVWAIIDIIAVVLLGIKAFSLKATESE